MQIRGLEDVGSISVIGTAGMIVALGIAIWKLLTTDFPEGGKTELVHTSSDFKSYAVALMDVAFFYGGQANWVRYGRLL